MLKPKPKPAARPEPSGNEIGWAVAQMRAGKAVRRQADPEVAFAINSVQCMGLEMFIVRYPVEPMSDDDELPDGPVSDMQAHELKTVPVSIVLARDFELVP